jgi:motility quorum-sensing regulator/GCU-specific mRNA interferase toxin
MGLTVQEMIETVCNLNARCLYKSMTTYADATIWQDVYHADTPAGKAYVKLTLREDGAPVIQFKELEP